MDLQQQASQQNNNVPQAKRHSNQTSESRLRVYQIPIQRLLSFFKAKKMVRSVTFDKKQEIITWLYKSKLEYFTAYNYTYAVYLTGILNTEFDIQAQILTLPESSRESVEEYEKSGFQIVYRFDFYGIENQQGKTSQSHQKSSKGYLLYDQEPLKKLLESHYPSMILSKLMKEYGDRQKEQKRENKDSEQKKECTSFVQDQENIQNIINQHQGLRSKSTIDYRGGKFEFRIQQGDMQSQLTILLFEIYMLFSLHLKNYHLYHQFAQCGELFINRLKEIIQEYPCFSINNSDTQKPS